MYSCLGFSTWLHIAVRRSALDNYLGLIKHGTNYVITTSCISLYHSFNLSTDRENRKIHQIRTHIFFLGGTNLDIYQYINDAIKVMLNKISKYIFYQIILLGFIFSVYCSRYSSLDIWIRHSNTNQK